MATELSFTANNGGYECTFTSEGEALVQVNTTTAGSIIVNTSIGGMTPAPIHKVESPFGKCVFRLDIPSGLDVIIWSSAEVTQAMMQLEE